MCLVKPYQSKDNDNFASAKDTNFIFPWMIANSLTTTIANAQPLHCLFLIVSWMPSLCTEAVVSECFP